MITRAHPRVDRRCLIARQADGSFLDGRHDTPPASITSRGMKIHAIDPSTLP
jgi:hypothetical protein